MSRAVARSPARRGELLLLAASTGLLLALLGAAEAWARRAGDPALPEGAQDLGTLHVYSERYGWALRPGYSGTPAGARVTVNPRGYRGPQLRPRPEPGRERVVLLGDSVAFGLGVGDLETFAALLGASAGREVLNLAVQGYGPDQELLRLEDEGLGYGPDTVVLALCVGNDFVDVALDRFLYDGQHPKPYFTLEAGQLVLHDAHLRLGVAGELALWLGERSHLYRRLNAALAWRQRPGWHWMRTVEELEPRWAQGVAIVRRIVERMAERCREAGARFLVASFPYRRSWDEGSLPLDTLQRLLGDAGIAYLDVGAAFRARGLAFEALTTDKLGHLNARGHREAAAVLEEALGPQP